MVQLAGRGMNGQKSRSGGGVRLGFEGGQMPLYRRLTKERLHKHLGNRIHSSSMLMTLNKFEAGTVVTPGIARRSRSWLNR